MNGDGLRGWLENPVFVKHLRSRLRPQAFISGLVVVVVLCLCMVWAGYQLEMFTSGGTAGWLLGLQCVLLIIMGSAQVNASVNGARSSGILDFHRVTPMTATELTFGFFFGAPIREYLLFAATLPFFLICMAFGVPSPRAATQLMIFLLTTTWSFHALSLLSGLLSKAKNPTGNVIAVIVIVMLFGLSMLTGGNITINFAENDHRLDFYGLSLPWLPVVLLFQLPLLFFLLLASCRKMRSDRLHPLTKLQAIAAMVTFGALILGGTWKQEPYEVVEVGALYALVVPALLLTLMVTPNQAEYYKGLWRAQKQGRQRLPWWDDLSVNWACLAILAGTVLAIGSIAGSFPGPRPAGMPDGVGVGSVAWSVPGPTAPGGFRGTGGSFPLALALAVLVVAYFGLAIQYFQLRFAGRGKMYFGLFLFLTWALPMVAGSIQTMAGGRFPNDSLEQCLFALGPIAGIGMVAVVGDQNMAPFVQFAAIAPALLFTFVFNYLLIGARKRVIKAVYVAAIKSQPPRDELTPFGPIWEPRTELPSSRGPAL